MPRIQKTHYVTLRLVFDQPTLRKDASRAAKALLEKRVFTTPAGGVKVDACMLNTNHTGCA